MADVRAADGDATITVASSSRDTRRLVGPLAWIALEELALRAVAGNGALEVETSVRDLAGSLGTGKDAIAAALTRLTELGLVRCQTRRAAGRYAGSAYLLEVDACRRAGLVLHTTSRPSLTVSGPAVSGPAVSGQTGYGTTGCGAPGRHRCRPTGGRARAFAAAGP